MKENRADHRRSNRPVRIRGAATDRGRAASRWSSANRRAGCLPDDGRGGHRRGHRRGRCATDRARLDRTARRSRSTGGPWSLRADAAPHLQGRPRWRHRAGGRRARHSALGPPRKESRPAALAGTRRQLRSGRRLRERPGHAPLGCSPADVLPGHGRAKWDHGGKAQGGSGSGPRPGATSGDA